MDWQAWHGQSSRIGRQVCSWASVHLCHGLYTQRLSAIKLRIKSIRTRCLKEFDPVILSLLAHILQLRSSSAIAGCPSSSTLLYEPASQPATQVVAAPTSSSTPQAVASDRDEPTPL